MIPFFLLVIRREKTDRGAVNVAKGVQNDSVCNETKSVARFDLMGGRKCGIGRFEFGTRLLLLLVTAAYV